LQNNFAPKVKINDKEFLIAEVFVHPKFETIINDIALVRLQSKASNNRYVRLNMSIKETEQLIIIAGMGDVGTGLTGPKMWDKITRGATNKIEGADDKWIWFTFDAPGSANVTELEGISGPGDSGGPALIESENNLFLAGISSHQKGEGKKKGTYGVIEYYTKVSGYYNWITETMKHNPTSKSIATKIKSEVGQNGKLKQYAGSFGFRKIIWKDGGLFFQRENEPLISMKEIGKDLFLWDDDNTKLQFIRNKANEITGFEIHRKNGEVVKADKTG